MRRWLNRIAKKDIEDIKPTRRNIRRANWVKLLKNEPGFDDLSDDENALLNKLTAVRSEDAEPIEKTEDDSVQEEEVDDSIRKEKVVREGERDLVLVLSPNSTDKERAAILAPDGEILRVRSLKDIASALTAIDFPIRTLFFVGHGRPGEVQVEDDQGNKKWESLSDIASALKDTIVRDNAPNVVDFQGCRIGRDARGMYEVMEAVGATEAVGGTCFLIVWVQGPVLLGNEEITDPANVDSAERDVFEDGLEMLRDAFGEAQHCILDDSEEAYFRNRGRFFAMWFARERDTKWNQRNRCYSDLEPETVDLRTEKGQKFADELANAPGAVGGPCELIKIIGQNG